MSASVPQTKAAPTSTKKKSNVGLIKTPPGTLCFPNLFTPRPMAVGAEPRFSCILLFDEAAQKMPAWKELRQSVLTVVEEQFGAEKAKSMLKSLRLPFRDAGEKEYNGFQPGMVFISPWQGQAQGAPQVVDKNGDTIVVPGDVWAGQLVRGAVRPFYYENSGNRGVSFGLHSIQIIERDMPRLDGRKDARAIFDDGQYSEPGGGNANDDLPF
jgi:hypothetical protein